MKMNKMISIISAVAMLSSLSVALPMTASASTTDTTVAASEGLAYRVGFTTTSEEVEGETVTTKTATSFNKYRAISATVAEENAMDEVQYGRNSGKGFGAIYKYDLSSLINGADPISNVKLNFTVTNTQDNSQTFNVYLWPSANGIPANDATGYGNIDTFMTSSPTAVGTTNVTNNGARVNEGNSESVEAEVTLATSDIVNGADVNGNVYLLITGSSVNDDRWHKIVIDGPDRPALTVTTSGPVAMIGENRYTSLDDAITAANAASADCTIELLENATQTVVLNPDVNVTLDANGNTITGSGTLYRAKASGSKVITIQDATLNIANTSTSAPALATSWKDNSKIILEDTAITADVVLYSVNNSTLAVTGNSEINGDVYLAVCMYGDDTRKFRTLLNLNGYTGTESIDVSLIEFDENGDASGNHSSYAVGDTIITNASGLIDKIDFTNATYDLAYGNNGDIVLAEKSSTRYATITGTADRTYTKLLITNSDALTAEVDLDTNIVSGSVSLGVAITNVPLSVTITDIALD